MSSGPVSNSKGTIADPVHNRMRAGSATQSTGNSESTRVVPARGTAAVRLREAQFSDFERVSAMNLRLGQGPDSPENWKRLWIDNPAVIEFKAAPRIGWVLESAGEIVGFLGSIPLLYEFEGKPLFAAATCRLAIEPAFRAYCHLLISSFFRQKNVDLFLNSTATVSAGKMMTALNAAPLPQADYGNVLFWVLDPRPFAKAVFKKLGMNSSFAGMGGAIGAAVLRGDIKLRRRGPRSRPAGNPVVETNMSEMGNEFNQLWSDGNGHPARLMAKRTAAIMRWHFDPPQNRRKIRVLSFKGASELGYLIVRHEEKAANGLQRSLVADLMIKNDDSDVLEQLLAAACRSAKSAGSQVLEIMGFPRNIRESVLKLKPYSRRYPAPPFFYKARERALHEKLTQEGAWYASPFDGDTTLWP